MWNHLLQLYDESRLNAGLPDCLFAETLIFNEGWLLRSVMREWKRGATGSCLPFLPFPDNVTIYSEGQLLTPFKARFQGDPQAESHAHVDGIAGHLSLAAGTKSGIEVSPGCRYIAVFEAKLYSPIARGTTNAPGYDQVSRITACLIHALLEAGPRPDCRAHVVVLYPEDNPHVLPGRYTRDGIAGRIRTRLAGYGTAGGSTRELDRFAAGWEEALGRVEVEFVTWETVLAEIGELGPNRFYELCRHFNRPPDPTATWLGGHSEAN